MKPICLVFILFAYCTLSSAQTATPNQIPALEEQLGIESNPREKARLCTELSFAYAKKDVQKALEYAQRAGGLAKEAGDAKLLLLSYNLLGDAYIRKSDFPAAEAAYQSALSALKNTPDEEMEAKTWHNLGKLSQSRQDMPAAIAYYEKAFVLRKKIGDKAGLSSTTYNLGVLWAEKHQWEESNTYLFQALALKEETGDQVGIANAKSALANNYMQQGRLIESEKLINESIVLNQTLGNKRGLANDFSKRAAIYMNGQSLPQAVESFLEAKKLATELNDKLLLGSICNNLGQCYADMGSYPESKALLLEALPLAESLKQEGLLFTIYMGLGYVKGYEKLYDEEAAFYDKAAVLAKSDHDIAKLQQARASMFIGQQKYETALSASETGLVAARKAKEPEQILDNLIAKASALRGLQRFEEALRSIQEAVSINQKIKNKARASAIARVESELLIYLKKDQAHALSKAQESLRIALQMGQLKAVENAYEQVSEAWKVLGNAAEAVNALKKAQAYRDSVLGADKIRALTAQEKDYVFQKERDAQQTIQRNKDAEIQKQTSLKKGLLLALGLLSLISMLSFLFWRKRQKRIQYEKDMETRNRLSRDIHDDLGSGLSSIALNSQLAAKVSDPDKMREVLTKIGEEATDISDKVKDLVWSINPEADSMQELLSRMRRFAANVLEDNGVGLVFRVDEGVEGLPLDLETRRNLYLIFKEAVNNCAKYAKATTLNAEFRLIDKKLIVEIKDNGIGFDPKTVTHGNGLKNIYARAALMHAQLDVETSVNAGTKICLNIGL